MWAAVSALMNAMMIVALLGEVVANQLVRTKWSTYTSDELLGFSPGPSLVGSWVSMLALRREV